MSERLSAEQIAYYRDTLRTGRRQVSYVFIGRDLLAELDAVTRERDALQSQLDEFISARANGRSANDD